MFDLSGFSLSDMVRCSAEVRRSASDAGSLEEAAAAVVSYLYDHLGDPASGTLSSAMVRLFKTHPTSSLEGALHERAHQLLEGHPDPNAVKCLVLLASQGAEEEWCDRTRSRAHAVIPLPGADIVAQSPMIAALLHSLGVDLEAVIDVDGDPGAVASMDRSAFGVFHVEDVEGSELVPDQDFVRRHGVRSALGFGGALPSGDVFAVVIFSRSVISAEVADLFRAVGVSVKVALLPFVDGRVFAGDDRIPLGPRRASAESLADALQQLLDVHEATAFEQTRQAERTMQDIRDQAAELARSHQRLEDEARIIETLHYVGSSLTAELELDRLVSSATEAATVVTGAEFGAFFYNVIDEAGERYTLYTVAGASRDHFSKFPMPRATPVFGPTFRGEDIVRSPDITKDPRFGRMAPHFGMPPGHLPVRSYLAVPVVSRSGEVLGGLFFGHEAVEVFDERDERLAYGIAAQAAIAIDNARLYSAAGDARLKAEATAARLARLQAVTAALSSIRVRQDVAEVVTSEVRAELLADMVSVSLLHAAGKELLLANQQGLSSTTAAEWGRLPVSAAVPASDAVRSGAPVVIGSIEERDARYPHLAHEHTYAAFATLPLVVEGRTLGALTVGWTEPRAFSGEEREFLMAVARQCAQAFERARLAEAERRAVERQTFLADAGRELASSLDLDETLSQLCRLVVPRMAETSWVYLAAGETFRLVTVASQDPEKERLMRLVGDMVASGQFTPVVAGVATSGSSIFFSEMPEAMLGERIGGNPGRALAAGRLGIRSFIAVALRAGGRPIGVLVATRGDDQARFDAIDLATLEELAGRAASAIANARAHQERTEVARTLQQSLLPPALIDIPGLQLASRYHPVGEGTEVGGDFYDVFPIGEGRYGVVMGDVCGKGIPAAALTSLARYTVRTAAMRETAPSEVLGVLNRAIEAQDVGERFCTIAHAFLEASEGRVAVTLALGGHPFPLLLTSAGEVRAVGEVGSAVGLFAEFEATDVHLSLEPGDALVLFTDGVTEARAPDGRFAGQGLVEEVLAQAVGQDAEGIAASIEAAIRDFQGGRPRDDLALLVLRMDPPAPDAAEAPGG